MTYAELATQVGKEIGVSSWVRVDQALIDDFARLTGDHGFIHVDPVRAASTSFGTTIAHGLLTVALTGGMGAEVLPEITDRAFLMNYGYDKIRLLAPVPTGSRIRARYMLASAETRSERERLLRFVITIEREGAERPAMIAESILMVVLR